MGGITVFSGSDYEKVNGWSNLFENWGGEDDDMSNRFLIISHFVSLFYGLVFISTCNSSLIQNEKIFFKNFFWNCQSVYMVVIQDKCTCIVN